MVLDHRDYKVIVEKQDASISELHKRAFPDLEKKNAEKELNSLTDQKAELETDIALLTTQQTRFNDLKEKIKAFEEWNTSNPDSSRSVMGKQLNDYEEMLKSLEEKISESNEFLQKTEACLLSEERPDNDGTISISGNAEVKDGKVTLQEDTVIWEYLTAKKNRDVLTFQHKGLIKAREDIIERINRKTRELGKLDEESPDLTAEERSEYDKHLADNYDEKIENLSQISSAVNDSIDALVGKIEDHGKWEAIRERNVQERNELDLSIRKYETIKSVIKGIKTLQSDIVNSAVKNAKETINSVVSGILSSPIDWDGKTLGRRGEDEEWIPFDTFSGSEKAVTQMALGIALASRSNLKLAVLDEVSRLDAENKTLLIENLNTLIDNKVIAQYIILCIELPKDIDDNHTVINTDSESKCGTQNNSRTLLVN